MVDQGICRLQDGVPASIILFERNHFGARKVSFEIKDVFDVRPTP